MSNPQPKGLALTAAIMSIVTGSLITIGGVVALGYAGRIEEFAIIGIIALLIGVTAITLGAIGCAIKPGIILAIAIIFTVLTVLGLLGLAMGPSAAGILGLLLYGVTCAFGWMGWPQAKQYREWQINPEAFD